MKGTTIKNHIENLLTRMRLCEVHLQEAEDRVHALENCFNSWNRQEREKEYDRIQALESRIDALEHPMGRIESKRGAWYIQASGNFSQGLNQYVFANKEYIVELPNITSFRKKGDYVEIKWEEEIEVPEHILVPNGNLTEKQKEEFISNNGMFVNVNETDGIVKIRAGKQKITKTRTFLLKDTLIPLDAVYDFGDTPWVEVEK